MPSMMASVSGRLILNTLPAPCSERISTAPRRRSMFFLTTSMPTPRPETSVTTLAVENPGSMIRL